MSQQGGAEVNVEVAGVLFDMDGVLVSSIGSVRRCWREWARRYGVPNADQVEIAHGSRAVDVMELLKPGVDKREGLRMIEDLEIDDVADLRVLPGARELLVKLPIDRWTIVTSATYRLLVERLKAAGLPMPERLVSADVVERGKPDPEPYLRGAELLGRAAKHCLVVEDAPTGVRAGVAAGCRVLGVEGTHPAEQLYEVGAEWVVTSLEEVEAEMAGEQLRVLFRPVARD